MIAEGTKGVYLVIWYLIYICIWYTTYTTECKYGLFLHASITHQNFENRRLLSRISWTHTKWTDLWLSHTLSHIFTYFPFIFLQNRVKFGETCCLFFGFFCSCLAAWQVSQPRRVGNPSLRILRRSCRHTCRCEGMAGQKFFHVFLPSG